MTQLFSGMLQAIIGQATALQTTSMNNQTNMDITQMNNLTQLETTKMINEMSKKVAQIGASAMLGTANINAKTNLTLQQQEQAFKEYMAKTYPTTVPQSVNALSNNFTNWLKGHMSTSRTFGENISLWLKELSVLPNNNGKSW